MWADLVPFTNSQLKFYTWTQAQITIEAGQNVVHIIKFISIIGRVSYSIQILTQEATTELRSSIVIIHIFAFQHTNTIVRSTLYAVLCVYTCTNNYCLQAFFTIPI